MKIWIARLTGVLATLLLAGTMVDPAQADPLTAADFAAPASVISPSLSPSGRYLAWVARSGENNEIHIQDLETGEIARRSAGGAREHFGGVFIESISWKGDDRLLISATQLELRRVGDREDGAVRAFAYRQSVLSVARDGSSAVSLKGPGTEEGRPGELLDTLPDDAGHVLMSYRGGEGRLHVARVNIQTGEAVKIVDGTARVLSYLTDRDGAVVGRTTYRGLTGRVLVMEALGADGRWGEVFRMRRDELRDLPDYRFLGATDQPGQSFVAVRPKTPEEGDTTAVHVFDFATRQMGPAIWRHETYDVSGIVVGAGDRSLMAGCYWADIYRCDFSDRQENAVMNGIRAFLGEGWSVSVVSQAEDRSRWVVRASAPNNPGEYYIFDLEERKMELLGQIYPQLPEASLGAMRRVDYAASDGRALFGYLTRPPGAAEGGRPPLVVLPHGGPEARDVLSYDRWAQFLATRGYQVFQPNFRGSSGMGRAFVEAGHRQWGLRMQDDVTEGVQSLVAQGLVDAEQVCIVGASYGGYAALQAGASQPDLYQCAISIAGPSDLLTMLRHERSEGGADSDRYEYWVRSIGDPTADRAAIEAASPLNKAAGWSIPLLLIHGEDDTVVPVAQSRNMERALRREGKPVRLVVMDGAGHTGWSRADEIRVMVEMEAFLREHLPLTGAAPEPAAPAETAAQAEVAPAA
ncbi:MAG: S9 family peptidase [Brevundimonas sp.]|nr:S9 family peptidase [Brevundimonas sp.]